MADVVVQHLVKTYGKLKTRAVNDVSFSVEAGELFGLIGPDGAGKTSIFRILATLLLPDSGYATVRGFNVFDDYKSIRREVGYMPGRFSLYQDLTVKENLDFFATIFNTTVSKNYHLIKDIYVQIEPFKNRRAGKLSGGMKQKLALCCALIHKPSVLFLDEPTTGVDTVSRKEFWQMLKTLKQQGITILVSTPYMDEATLCERVALLQNGTFLSIDTPAAIVRKHPRKLFAVRAENMIGLMKDLRASQLVESANAFGDKHHVTLSNDDEAALMTEMRSRSHTAIEITAIQPSIEDCFISLMSNPAQN